MNFSAFLLPGLCAFLLALMLIFLVLKFFPRWGLMDRPERYGLKRAPIPYSGGLAIFGAFALMVLFFVPLSVQVLALLLGGGVITLLGFFDDRFGLSPFLRLFVQFFAGVILVWGGVGVLSINLPVLGMLDFTTFVWDGVLVLSAVFTIIWVMTLVNTMNFVDGVPGIASGVGFVSGLTIFLLSINPRLHENLASQHDIALIALIFSMACLAFLCFDFPRPRLLMGDTGSTFLGFMIAALAIFSGGKVATAFIVLGLPILDMIWVVVRRTLSGGKFWQGDRKHLHHRLLDKGFSEGQVVALYLAITLGFGLSAALMVNSLQKLFMIGGVIIFMILLALSLVFLKKKT